MLEGGLPGCPGSPWAGALGPHAQENACPWQGGEGAFLPRFQTLSFPLGLLSSQRAIWGWALGPVVRAGPGDKSGNRPCLEGQTRTRGGGGGGGVAPPSPRAPRGRPGARRGRAGGGGGLRGGAGGGGGQGGGGGGGGGEMGLPSLHLCSAAVTWR